MDRSDSETSEPLSDVFELPLFPLHIALYPGMLLPLQIFEDRYKSMLRYCLDNEEDFGVVLIKEGSEVGDPAVPFEIGTTAHIIDSKQIDGGRIHVLGKGMRRFEILELLEGKPYMRCRAQYLAEESGDLDGTHVEETRAAYSSFLINMTALSGGATATPHIPKDPMDLSYSIAAKVAACVKLPAVIRQDWLASSTCEARIRNLGSTLEKLNEALEDEVAKRSPTTDILLN